jgi:hypothetical protein
VNSSSGFAAYTNFRLDLTNTHNDTITHTIAEIVRGRGIYDEDEEGVIYSSCTDVNRVDRARVGELSARPFWPLQPDFRDARKLNFSTSRALRLRTTGMQQNTL